MTPRSEVPVRQRQKTRLPARLVGRRPADHVVEASPDLVNALARCDRSVQDWAPSDDFALRWEDRPPAAPRPRPRASPAIVWWNLRHSRKALYARSRLVLLYALLAVLAAGIGVLVVLLLG